MSLFLDGTDPFEGLRVLPRDPNQLRHHLSRIHHTLQTKYYISAELSEFALQPDRSTEFLHGYQKEIERTVAALNQHCHRSQIKVRVDPTRISAGLEVKRVALTALSAPAEEPTEPREHTNGWGEKVSPSLTAKLESRQEAEHQLFLAGQSTPAAGKGALSPDGLSTGGGAFVNSEAKTERDSYLFSTPPEFKGFGNANPASPSDGVSPGA